MRDAQKLPPRGLVYASIYRRHVLAMLRCENALELVDLMRSIDLLAAGSLEFKGGPDYWGPEIDMGAPFLRWRYETSQTDAEHLSIALTNMDGSESFRLRVFAWEGGKVSRRGHANYLCYCRPPRHEYDYDHKSSRGIRTAWAFKWILGYGWSCGQFPETDEGKSVRAPFKGCGKGWELGRLQPTITLER
jgi:hypothetical protein